MWKAVIAAGLAVALPLSPLAAQSDSMTAEDAIATAKQVYGPPPPTKRCIEPAKQEKTDENEIVVCARTQDDSQFRVKSTSQIDPNSEEALDDGLPRAPDFAKSCKNNPGGACMKMGGTPVPVYMLDFSLLPDTPEGSDADKISKGEKKAP